MRLRVAGLPAKEERDLASLIEIAREAASRAYCPYSNFPVGAALVTDTGNFYAGCNVENVSYGLSICAERNAIFSMVASGERHISKLIVYTPTAKPVVPCGACRQVLGEFGEQSLVFSAYDGGIEALGAISDLLPNAFSSSALKTSGL